MLLMLQYAFPSPVLHVCFRMLRCSMLLPAAESREHSDSIRMAQAKLVPVVPYHLPDAGVINHLIARSKQSNVRSGGGSHRVQVVPEQAGGAPGTATGGGSSHDAQGVEATAI